MPQSFNLTCSINQFLSTPSFINGTGEVTAGGVGGGGGGGGGGEEPCDGLAWGISNSASRLMLQIPE